MKSIINNNNISISNININPMGIIPDIAIVRNVKPVYKVDDQGKRTGTIDAIRYECINTLDFSTFTIKTVSTKPVVSEEDIENSETPIRILIPVSEVVIRPYKIEYGIATVSIMVPSVKLAPNEKVPDKL